MCALTVQSRTNACGSECGIDATLLEMYHTDVTRRYVGSAGDDDTLMLALLLVVPYVVFASLASGAPESKPEMAWPEDVLMTVFAQAGIAALLQGSRASSNWHRVANQAITALYGIQHGGETHLNYTKVFHEHDALVHSLINEGTETAASMGLEGSPEYLWVRSIIRARFGHCIKYSKGRLPQLDIVEFSLDILNDRQRISAVPYLLDRDVDSRHWIYLIRGLVELGRFDLLDQLSFARIGISHFYKLASLMLPKGIIQRAAEALRKNEACVELGNLVALATPGDHAVSLSDECEVPLLFFRYLHEQGVSLPESCVLTDGLEASSIPFWMYVLQKEARKVEQLLGLVLKHGDTQSKFLANAFYGPVSDFDLLHREKDVYRAMLIHFNCSAACSGYIAQNYAAMQRRVLKVGPHTARAFIDCGSAQLLHQYRDDGLFLIDFQALADKLCRLHDQSMIPLAKRCLERSYMTAKLLKRLVQTKADDSYIQLVWGSIKSMSRNRLIDDHCCFAPVEVLRRLVFEPEISIEDARRMLSMLDGFDGYGDQISKEAHAAYTVMFWEAPEGILEHFLGKAPHDLKLDCVCSWGMLHSKKYSRGFWTRLVERCGSAGSLLPELIAQFRPDLAKEPDPQEVERGS